MSKQITENLSMDLWTELRLSIGNQLGEETGHDSLRGSLWGYIPKPIAHYLVFEIKEALIDQLRKQAFKGVKKPIQLPRQTTNKKILT